MRQAFIVLPLVMMALRFSRAFRTSTFTARNSLCVERSFLLSSSQQHLGPLPHPHVVSTKPHLSAHNYVTLAQKRRNIQSLLASLQETEAKEDNEEEIDPGEVDGTDLRIVRYPHPSLRTKNEEVTPEELKDGSMAQLAKEMFLMMYAAQGVGLAAPQVGVNKRLMIYNESGDPKKWLDEIVLVNPTIVEFSDSTDIENEGCLSFPGIRGDVPRSKWIKVEALNLKGKKVKRKFVDWEARIFQHEYDHLDGVVFTDRVTEDSKQKAQPQLQQLIKEFGEGGIP